MAQRFCVIGLGNPGRRYQGTRHNIGFDWLDAAAASFSAPSFQEKFDAQWAVCTWKEWELHFLKPMTWMNRSGESLRLWQKKHQGISRFLVAYDDVDIELGQLRLRQRGSDGGHRGLRSVLEVYGSRELPRLRIGVGKKAEETAEYVLSKFKPEEKVLVQNILEAAPQHLQLILDEGIEKGMNQINSFHHRGPN